MPPPTPTVLIGSTDGVGRYVATSMAAQGAHVLVHGRDAGRAASIVEEIGRNGGSARFIRADFASLTEVRALAETVLKEHDHLDVLVNNAGIGVGRNSRELSQDGHELRLAVNYLSGFLLTQLLLPILGRQGSSRIVNVSSAGQQALDFDDVMLTRGYSGRRAYCQYKLAQVMYTIDLAARLADRLIAVNALHPATCMDTAMVRRDGVRPLSTVADGGNAILRLANARELAEVTGRYFDGTRESRPHEQAFDASARSLLRTISLDLTGLGSSDQT